MTINRMQSSRRDFLRALVATAVAVGLPNLPAAKAKTLTELITEKFFINFNGKPPIEIQVTEEDDGWCGVKVLYDDVVLDPDKLPVIARGFRDASEIEFGIFCSDDAEVVMDMTGMGDNEKGMLVVDRYNIPLLMKSSLKEPNTLAFYDVALPVGKCHFTCIVKPTSEILKDGW